MRGGPTKASAEVTSTAPSTNHASSRRASRRQTSASRPASNAKGVMTMAPPTSPSHQVSATEPTSADPMVPLARSEPTPKSALTADATKATPTSASTWRRVSKLGSKPSRRSIHAPTTASRVFPMAMPRVGSIAVPIERFTAKAATKIAGAKRRPHTRSAASATPVGGQKSVALSCSCAGASPSRATTT